jgi:2-polyprenyl-6-methoxyphenol hydroxylase-like FAD-dependent oxidoreductase
MAQRVLIIGAGPTGLMLAIELARHGVTPRVIEKRREPAPTSRALAVFARTLELFDRAGVIDAALAAGRRLRGGALHDGRGRDIAAVSTDHLDSPFPFVLCLPQAETERILACRAADFGVRAERGIALERIDAPTTNAPIARLRREDGAVESLACDWIIGCDGAHSEVRDQAGIAFRGVDLHQAFVFADAVPSWNLSPDRFHAFLAPGGVIAAVPLPEDGLWRVIASLPPGTSSPEKPSLAEIEAMVQQRARLAVTLRDARWVTGFEVRQRRVNQYRAGRLLLAGDAAHAHSPIGGQGMNTGLQDAANLGWKLALVAAGRADASLLDTYHDEREPIARGLLSGTGFATRAASLANPVSIGLRNFLLRRLLGVRRVRERLITTISEIGIQYRDSRLSIDLAPTGTVRAGDRAPDLPMTFTDGGSDRLHNLLRHPWFHMLVFVAEGDQRAREIATRAASLGAAPLTVHLVDLDRSKEAATRFCARESMAVLIRPDGYIGARISSLREDVLTRALKLMWVHAPRSR